MDIRNKNKTLVAHLRIILMRIAWQAFAWEHLLTAHTTQDRIIFVVF